MVRDLWANFLAFTCLIPVYISLLGISYLSLEEEKAVRAKIPALRAMDAGSSSSNDGPSAAPQEPGYSEVVLDAAAREVVDKEVYVAVGSQLNKKF
jgi:hypothetical protein